MPRAPEMGQKNPSIRQKVDQAAADVVPRELMAAWTMTLVTL